MNIKEISKYDESFNFIYKADQWQGFDDLSKASMPKEGSAVFIKNKRFFNLFKEQVSSNNYTLILEKKFFESGDVEKSELENISQATGTVESIDFCMCALSVPFAEAQDEEQNDLVDGRQLGTAQIHPKSWIAQGVFIGANVTIGENCKIYPGATLMSHCKIGDGTTIFPNVTVYPYSEIGKNCRIHSGTVVGGDGFGYNFLQGKHVKVWHIGKVVIGNDVEIGSLCSIDRGTFDDTKILDGAKIDSHVHVAHNTHVGAGVIMCGQAATAGSAVVGDFTVMGGAALVGPDVSVGKGCQIAGRAGVTHNLKDGEVVGGFPARDLKEWLRGVATLRKLSKK